MILQFSMDHYIRSKFIRMRRGKVEYQKKDELCFTFPLHQLKYIIYVQTLYYCISKTRNTYIVQKYEINQ